MTRNRSITKVLNNIDSAGQLGPEDLSFSSELTSLIFDSVGQLTLQPTGSIAYISGTEDVYFFNGIYWLEVNKGS